MGISVPALPIEVTVKQVRDADKLPVEYENDLAGAFERLRSILDKDIYWEVDVSGRVFRHAGLGSTTQVVGAALIAAAAIAGKKLDFEDLFQLGVGRVSVVGLTLLYEPGCIIEFGYSSSSNDENGKYVRHPLLEGLFQKPAGVGVRLMPPSNWTVILAVPKNRHSLSGELEDDFWSQHLPTSVYPSMEVSYATLMQIMPGVVAGNFGEVREGLVAAHAQGTKLVEEELQDDQTKRLISDFRRRYQFAGVTSLGPATYTLLEGAPSLAEMRSLACQHDEFEFVTFAMAG